MNQKNGYNSTFVLSSHTRRVKIAEQTAKLMLRIAAALTMGALFIVIGYILYRGFVSDVRRLSEFFPRGSTVISIEENIADYLIVIVNDNIRISELTLTELVEIFTGELDNWGNLSEQDIDVKVFIPGNKSIDFFKNIISYEAIEITENAVAVNGDKQIISHVSETDGGIGFISESSLVYLSNTNTKPIEVRRYSIVVSNDVFEASEAERIHYLTKEQVKNIFTGTYRNWSELGSIDAPIVTANFKKESRIQVEFKSILLDDGEVFSLDAKILSNSAELADFLQHTPGAVGFVYHTDAQKHDMSLLNLQKRETEVNLNTAFMLEEPRRAGRVGGISTIIANTIFMIMLTIIFSAPIGIAAAVYLTEYAKQGLINDILRFGTETLAGIPSIIFGLFGFVLFVMYLNIGVGLLSGTLTVSFMILPTIIRASEEAIKSVPQTLRESSLALGATKWQTVVKVVVPAAVPGILTGLILAIGRAVGETAALLFTMGSDYRLARDLLSSARVLSVHLYILVREGISFERAFATGTILIIIILLINFATNKMISRMSRMHG